ncbi:MAG: hypothetical protein ACE141_06240 [Bryobacteraceae bacterium]
MSLIEVSRPKRPVPERTDWSPQSEEDRQVIREQLARMLADPLFRRSKGCSSLLAYIVDRTLEGGAERLKERTIGAEVFGRAPDYDTSSDHVVRSTAGEVRKRLAQYYMEPGRSLEVRIDVPPGSYVPRFSRYRDVPMASLQEPENGLTALVSAPQAGGGFRSAARRLHLRSAAILAALILAAVLSAIAIRAHVVNSPARVLDRFWQPVLDSENPVLLCIGDSDRFALAARPESPQPAGDSAGQVLPNEAFRGGSRVFLNDAITLARVAGWLQHEAKPYNISVHSSVTFSDLQNSPAVLIGLRNNFWTASLAGPLRFKVERGASPNILILRDKKNPSRNDWVVDLSTPYTQPTKDYALVARELNPKTGQIVVTIGGITRHGTIAASEFVTSPEQIGRLDAYGPKDWARKNVAIVLSTDVIRGSPGSAKIVAVDFW